MKIIEKFMVKNNFSSYSVIFERIVIECSIMKENKVDTNYIVKKVLEEISKKQYRLYFKTRRYKRRKQTY